MLSRVLFICIVCGIIDPLRSRETSTLSPYDTPASVTLSSLANNYQYQEQIYNENIMLSYEQESPTMTSKTESPTITSNTESPTTTHETESPSTTPKTEPPRTISKKETATLKPKNPTTTSETEPPTATHKTLPPKAPLKAEQPTTTLNTIPSKLFRIPKRKRIAPHHRHFYPPRPYYGHHGHHGHHGQHGHYSARKPRKLNPIMAKFCRKFPWSKKCTKRGKKPSYRFRQY